MKYKCNVHEVWIQVQEVEADSPEEAVAKINNNEGEIIEGDFEYLETLDSEVDDLEPIEENDEI